MARREIVTLGGPVLRERAREVTLQELASAGVQALVDDMIETMRAASGAGLAADQVVLFVDRVRDPTTLTTWDEFERAHRAAFERRARELVARVGS